MKDRKNNRYQAGKIYKLISSQTNDIYIGSTIQELTDRLYNHKYDYKNSHYRTSFEIVKYDDVQIELIENYQTTSKFLLEVREGY